MVRDTEVIDGLGRGELRQGMTGNGTRWLIAHRADSIDSAGRALRDIRVTGVGDQIRREVCPGGHISTGFFVLQRPLLFGGVDRPKIVHAYFLLRTARVA